MKESFSRITENETFQKDETYASYTRSILSGVGSCRSEKVSFGPCRSEKVAVRLFLSVVACNGTQLFQNDMVQN